MWRRFRLAVDLHCVVDEVDDPTVTDVVIDESKHDGVLKIFDFEAEGAELIAEGRIAPGSGWVFRRWRFNRRIT